MTQDPKDLTSNYGFESKKRGSGNMKIAIKGPKMAIFRHAAITKHLCLHLCSKTGHGQTVHATDL